MPTRWDVKSSTTDPSPASASQSNTTSDPNDPSDILHFASRIRTRPTKKRRRPRHDVLDTPPSAPVSSSQDIPPVVATALAKISPATTHNIPPSKPHLANKPPARRSRWDAVEERFQKASAAPTTTRTPSFRSRDIRRLPPSTAPTSARPSMLDDGPGYKSYQQEQERAEREWYLGEYSDRLLLPPADETVVAERQSRRLTAKAAAKHADAARWEERQMGSALYASAGRRAVDVDISDDAGPRVALLVKELVPNFLVKERAMLDDKTVSALAGKGNAVIGEDVVLPVKDPTSNMAIIARKGSQTVTLHRETRERGKARVKYWELDGAAGAKDKEQAENAAERDAQTAASTASTAAPEDWKADMKFSSVLKKQKTEKVTEDGETMNSEESIAMTRRSLPAYSVKDQLMNVIREHQICVIVGETGSGKTTQLTQYLEEEGYARFGMIGCTQPRRVAAVSVAQRVAEEFRGGTELGQEVGYTIRFEDTTSERTVIKYMTDGILLRESLSDPELDRYSVIIMDEAHERSLNTDVLFGVLRGVVTRRQDLKVIITSATLNAEKFADFFGAAPIFKIPGRTFPVDTFFSKTPIEDYVDGAVWQAVQIHIQAPLPGDILIFMTGQEDIETTCEALAEKIGKLENPRALLILPIYSQLAADLQAKIFEPAPDGYRKVVVATNIAETSLTIDGVQYVIDSGYCKLKTYNPRLGMDALLLCPASQSSANQRSGRAGRTGPGKCYRLFTSSAYVTELLETNVPEIQRTNLSHVVLLLKTLGVNDLLDFPFLDPPPAENILKSMLGLWLLGALGLQGALTKLGKRMSIFPLDPALSSLLFKGEELGCLVEAVTIVAMLSVPNVFIRPHGREDESDSAREKFFVPESDHLTLLHVYQCWRAAGCRTDWCAKHYISSKSMRKAREVREQLLEIVRTEGMTESSSDEWDSIRRAIAAAFFYQAARRKGIGEYINIRSGVVCGLHPTSALYGTGLSPDYVVYHELIMTRKEYMSCATAVDPYWLAEAGPALYILKQAGEEGVEAAMRLRERRAKIEDEMRSSKPT